MEMAPGRPHVGSDVGIGTTGLPWLFNRFPVTRGKRLGLRPLFLTLDVVLTEQTAEKGRADRKGCEGTSWGEGMFSTWASMYSTVKN